MCFCFVFYNQGRIIILDYFAEVYPVYSKTNSFFGQPFMWSVVHNFGGVFDLYGKLDSYNNVRIIFMCTMLAIINQIYLSECVPCLQYLSKISLSLEMNNFCMTLKDFNFLCNLLHFICPY